MLLIVDIDMVCPWHMHSLQMIRSGEMDLRTKQWSNQYLVFISGTSLLLGSRHFTYLFDNSHYVYFLHHSYVICTIITNLDELCSLRWRWTGKQYLRSSAHNQLPWDSTQHYLCWLCQRAWSIAWTKEASIPWPDVCFLILLLRT